jgi:filamentous hemagglutinin
LETGNGVPLVNIQTPNDAGVSRNSYNQFDVDQRGAILNNARLNAPTHLDGWVSGNPSLAAGTARVILNEVHSNDPSLLRGHIEVAGDRAQVIVANPAGITCAGCGFINATHATMTTGTPMFEAGALAHYRVQGGTIHVAGQGLDTRGADQTDLIARAVEVNAGIWAQRLAVTVGTNTVSADHAHVTQTEPSGEMPAFALDVGALGGMYAQKIVLVGTEHGVGVCYAGTMGAQVGELVVQVNGRLELVGGEMRAARVVIQAASLANQGGTIEQTGMQDFVVQAGSVRNRRGGRIGSATKVDQITESDHGTPRLSTAGELMIVNRLENSGGQILANGNIDLTARAGLNNDNGQLKLHRLAVQHAFSNRDGKLTVTDGVRIQASRFNNDGGQMHLAGPLVLQAQSLSNRGGMLAHSRRYDHHTQAIDLLGNSVADTCTLTATAGAGQFQSPRFINRAEICPTAGSDPIHITVRETFDNTKGILLANADLSITTATLINHAGRIEHTGHGDLTITADAIEGQAGAIVSNGSIKLTGTTLDLSAATTQGKTIEIDVETFTPSADKPVATQDNGLSMRVRQRPPNPTVVKPALLNNGGRPLDLNEEITPPEAGYQYLVYAVTWQPSFCKLKPGSAGCDQPPEKFLTHGIWPYNDSTDQKTNRHPAFCNSAPGCMPGTPCELSETTLAKIIQDPKIAELVPANPQGLFRHEWQKHGTCSGKSGDDYFRDIVNLRPLVDYDQPKFNTLIGSNPTFDEIKAAFPRNTSFRCFVQDGIQYLHEVFYLIDPTGKPYQKDVSLQIGMPCTSQATLIPNGI